MFCPRQTIAVIALAAFWAGATAPAQRQTGRRVPPSPVRHLEDTLVYQLNLHGWVVPLNIKGIEEPWHWFVWCSHLIDQPPDLLVDWHSWLLPAYSLEVRAAQVTFLRAVLPAATFAALRLDGTGEARAAAPEAFVTPQAREEFYALLQTLKPPADHMQPADTVMPDEPRIPQRYRRILTPSRNPAAASKADAMQRIGCLESFAVRHPRDRFLGGYARLYAGFLRMHWCTDVRRTESILSRLEWGYQDIPAIAIMAAWYRAYVLYFYGMPNAREAYRHLAVAYAEHRWWVVGAAQIVATGSAADIEDLMLFRKRDLFPEHAHTR